MQINQWGKGLDGIHLVLLFAVVILLALSGCTTNPARNIAIACQGYASTLSTLAVAKTRGQLSQGDIEAVDGLRPGLNAVCLDGDYNDPMASQAAVEAAMRQLILIEGKSQ